MAAPVSIPRLRDDLPLVTDKKFPDRAFTRFWNEAVTQIEKNLNLVIAAQDTADAAQADADAAMNAAIAAQAQADAAMAAATAAQATADAAKATADALDAALDVAAGKVLHVLKTLTLDAGADGATLNIGTGGTLGSAAFTNASDYLPSSSSTAFLAKASNLADVTSVPAARGNLGLGTAAVQNIGVAGANVPLLNGANTWGAAQIFSAAITVAGHTTFEGVTSTGATGTGRIVYDLSPTLTTPNIGAAIGTSLLLGNNAQIVNELLQVRQTAAAAFTAFFDNANAAPGASTGIRIRFTAAAPNDAAAIFINFTDSALLRAALYSNGGLANYSANNVNLSDAEVKGAVEPYDDKQLDALEGSFVRVNWGRFKYLDQSHTDWNHGYTAQGVEAAFAGVAPELVDETDIGAKPDSGMKHKGVYDSDLTHIGLALLSRALKRIDAIERTLG